MPAVDAGAGPERRTVDGGSLVGRLVEFGVLAVRRFVEVGVPVEGLSADKRTVDAGSVVRQGVVVGWAGVAWAAVIVRGVMAATPRAERRRVREAWEVMRPVTAEAAAPIAPGICSRTVANTARVSQP